MATCIECEGDLEGRHTVECNMGRDRAENRRDAPIPQNRGQHAHLGARPTDLGRLLEALGVGPLEFELERAKFTLSPRGWLDGKLRAAGWEREEDA